MTVPQLPGVQVRSRRGGSAWRVTASRLQPVADLVIASIGRARLSELDLHVESWVPPQEGWFGRPDLAAITELSLARSSKGAQVHLLLARPTDAGVVLAAALRCLRPTATGDVGPMLTFAPDLPVEASPLSARVVDVLVDDAADAHDPHVRRCDTLVVAAPDAHADIERATTIVTSTASWLRDGLPFDVYVDPAVHRPKGRRSVGGVVARGTVSGDHVAVTGLDVSLAITGSVTPADVRALRAVRAVVCDVIPSTRVAVQLTACGVLVVSAEDELPSADDDLGWQALSVHRRRHALRQFGPSAALDSWPTVSVVLATHRPDHLEHALRQVSGLRYPALEVIVGAHGDAVDAARVWDLSQEVPHPVTVVAIDGMRTLGEALQACSDRAQGALITKMDDDDVYGPDHVWDLVLAREYSGAQIVGKTLDWIYLESENATVFRPDYGAERYADFVAGGTMLMSRADLLAVGGWRPVPKSVDRALLDRVLDDGGLVYRTHGLGYVYVRHSAGHTASVSDAHFLTKVVDRHEGLVRHAEFGTQDGLPGWGAA